jgi:colanic acid/amylovoran biosynthesis glycosyltransferase
VTPATPVRRVGYVVSLFPSYDETFILREIKALSDRGVRLSIFSLRRRKQAVVQEDARAFVPETHYVSYLLSRDVLAALTRASLRQTRVVLGIVGLIVRGCWRRPTALLKSLAFVPKAIRFAEIAREQGIERLHAHWATYPATTALLMSRLTGIPWGLTCHAHDIFNDPSLLPEKIAEADFVLTCTADNKRYLEGLTPLATRKVTVVYHGLDLGRFHPLPHEATRSVRVLAVGSLLTCKGFDILIAALGLLRRRGLDVEATVAGGGPEERNLRLQAEKEGIADRVRFSGYLTQENLIPLYQAADIFVLPAVLGQHWGIANVLVEALACGVPVVTTPLPSLPELVEDGVHGLVARHQDPGDLAEKIERLARDPELRRRLGEAGRRRVEERFDIERNVVEVMRALGAES